MSTAAISVRDQSKIQRTPGRDLSIDYLRTIVTLIVLAHHSFLAYTSWAFLDRQNILSSTAPVVDVTRWGRFDYIENFDNVTLMALMFFVSGLFVYPALRKYGTSRFIRDRLLRLGVPFVFSVVFLMPIAYYAAWRLMGHDSGFPNFFKQLAKIGFISGPEWFIWVLLVFDVLFALAIVPLQQWMPTAERFMLKLKDRPFTTFLGIVFISVLAYLPLRLHYGSGAWVIFFFQAVTVQISRVGLYALWFGLGFLVGAPGYAEGLLSRSGGLAKHWQLWVLGTAIAYNVLWFAPRWSEAHRFSHVNQERLVGVLLVVSCTASCFGFLALFRGIEIKPRAWMNSLSRCAYGMYLVHYVYVLWMQYLFVNRPMHATIKFLFVFLATTLLSWLTVEAALRIPKVKTIL